MEENFTRNFDRDGTNFIRESVAPQPVNINKEMERNSTMLFLYQLAMWVTVLLGEIYLGVIVSLFASENVYNEMLLDSPGGQYIWMIVAVMLAYIPVHFYMEKQNLPLRKQLQKTSSSPKLIVAGIILCLAASSIGTLLLYPVEFAANYFGYTTLVEMETGSDAFYYVSSFLYVVIIGPIVEELVYRGGILMGLRRFGDRFAVGTSSIIFGLMHGNIPQIIFATMAGLVLGYICVKTNTLRYAILVHMTNNFIATVLSDYLYPNLSDTAINIVDWTFTIGFIILGGIVLYLVRGHLRLECVGEIPVYQPYRRYFTRVPMVLVMIVFILEIVFSFTKLS